MTAFDPELHHRRSTRLRGYDYARAGAYFVTICAQDRACLFGEIVAGAMRSNEPGRMIERWWAALGAKFPTLTTDAFILMPNHVHGIIILADGPIALTVNPVDPVGADPRVRPAPSADGPDLPDGPAATARGGHIGPPLPTVVQWFKTMTTNDYIRGVRELGWPPFRRRLWQRNYYDHVIRGEAPLQRIRDYIANNPQQWELDQFHPDAPSR